MRQVYKEQPYHFSVVSVYRTPVMKARKMSKIKTTVLQFM